jgi:hypothetical protein
VEVETLRTDSSVVLVPRDPIEYIPRLGTVKLDGEEFFVAFEENVIALSINLKHLHLVRRVIHNGIYCNIVPNFEILVDAMRKGCQSLFVIRREQRLDKTQLVVSKAGVKEESLEDLNACLLFRGGEVLRYRKRRWHYNNKGFLGFFSFSRKPRGQEDFKGSSFSLLSFLLSKEALFLKTSRSACKEREC